MAAERLSMRKIKEFLRLRAAGHSKRNVTLVPVADYVAAARSAAASDSCEAIRGWS